MISSEVLKDLLIESKAKIVLIVLDGLGGLPDPDTGKTELETAVHPNLDRLTEEGATGLISILGSGITPGSGAAHLALFGYDAFRHNVGRGAVAAMGIGMDMRQGDVAARVNFATIDENGIITDRRAGRIPTSVNAELCKMLAKIKIPDIELSIEPVKDHRAALILRGKDLCEHLSDTDPQVVGLPPKPVEPLSEKAVRTAQIANEFVAKAKEVLKDQHPANVILLRGFDVRPSFPSMNEVYGLNPACIAVYPDYRGVSRMVGMEVLETGPEIKDEFDALEKNYERFDFFYLHVKKTDSYGEDGNFAGKVGIIEETDAEIPRLLKLRPDILIVTGDHSTPALFKAHSWHPVPILFWGQWVRKDRTKHFGENECASGMFGTFPASEIMALALAHAGRLTKFGA